jgi:hypothetical protein
MHRDNLLVLAASQVVTAQAWTQNNIDLMQVQDLGQGKLMYLRLAAAGDITGTTSVIDVQPFLGSTPLVLGPTGVTATFTIAAPGVGTWSVAQPNLLFGSEVFFSNGGTLPTGVTAGTVYYVKPLTSTTFNLATSYANLLANVLITTTGTSTGNHPAAQFCVQLASTRFLPSLIKQPASPLVGGPIGLPMFVPVPMYAGLPSVGQTQNPPSPATPTTRLPYRWFACQFVPNGTISATLHLELAQMQDDPAKFYPTGIQPAIV